jgi:hypothetical protein
MTDPTPPPVTTRTQKQWILNNAGTRSVAISKWSDQDTYDVSISGTLFQATDLAACAQFLQEIVSEATDAGT